MPRSNAEIERDVYEAFKRVRNHFRQFEPLSVVFDLLSFLNSPNTAIGASYQPWLILLLIKWVFQDEQVWQRGRPNIDERNLRKLINNVYKAEEKGRLPNEIESIEMFFRRMAYQQFGYQNQTDGVLASFALDVKLFGSEYNPGFSQDFSQRYLLSVEEYLVLAFAIVSALISDVKPKYFQESFFEEIANEFERDSVQNFLSAISIHIKDIPKKFAGLRVKGKISEELYETSPFLNTPLIRTGNRCFVTYPDLVIRGLKYFLYGTLKVMGNDKRFRKFSELFENQVGQCLLLLDGNLITEEELKSKIGDQGRVVDFAYEEGTSILLVEAKALDLAESGRLATNAQRLKDRMKNVLDAIDQAEQTLNRMQTRGMFDPEKVDPFLVIVTYGQYYIGDGTLLGGLFRSTSFAKPKMIRVENIFIIGYAEFEYLTEVAKQSEVDLNSILTRVKDLAATPEDRQFMFQNYLDKLFPTLELAGNKEDPFTLLLERTLTGFNSDGEDVHE